MITVLGASGSLDKNKECISFLVNQTILIDAGNVMRALGQDSLKIEHVFLTHAHFDHITDLPFLIETHFEKRQKTLKIYGLKATLEVLEAHLFNGVIWPRFQEIDHPKLGHPMLEFVEIECGHTLQIDDIEITPISANHSIEACGFIVKQDNQGVLISGDTFDNPQLIDHLNQDSEIQTLLIDVSFPSSMDKLAQQSKHLTPTRLMGMLEQLKHPVRVYPYHLKPAYETEILAELSGSDFAPWISKVLEAGEQLGAQTSVLSMEQMTSAPDYSSEEKLASLLKIAQALSAETHLENLLEMILEQAMDFSNADAGTLYQLSPNRQELTFTVVQNRSLNIKMGGTQTPILWDNLPLYLENGEPNLKMVAALCALDKQVINIPDVYAADAFDFSGTRKFDEKTGYRSVSMLVIPLLDRNQELLGILQLINKQDPVGQAIAFSAQDQQSALALASQAAISLNNALLIQQLEELFESVLSTISKALDEKCSFSGAHVRQVAELSELIANGIDQDQSVYQDVHYSAEELHTIKVAALLHDVGKITTPEFIMQKATKLERVTDRIETIGERIEILKRDAEIRFLKAQLSASKSEGDTFEALQKTYQDEIVALDEIYDFLKQSNTGNDYLSDAEIAGIEELAKRTYQKNGETVPFLTPDEVLNLCIRAGTLNQSERAKIMDHARVSLEILQSLPFPRKYNRIVDIAANHHEKLDGSGYPRGLKADQLALEDRILILADLYEALSSQDRPYKEPHPLSKITQILSSMANDGLIDKTLVKFFFESGLYKQFNKRLKSSQIDEIKLTIN
ncbi:HD domain-containing phosphohydrolase [Thiomicrorhabdus chilensis]|uniref:HD domain-containing phosphohydrolase n=1 Tax=Thiomicrorhabdus chilensis TaxID=63656 RepID=UPI0003F801CC|nr:HD domain-containing phosphohydrolase [Thiomicrorhabdus chilensis]